MVKYRADIYANVPGSVIPGYSDSIASLSFSPSLSPVEAGEVRSHHSFMMPFVFICFVSNQVLCRFSGRAKETMHVQR